MNAGCRSRSSLVLGSVLDVFDGCVVRGDWRYTSVWDCRRLLLPLSRRCRRHRRRLSLPPLPSCRRRHRCQLSRRSCLRCTDWTVAPVIVLSASDVSRVLQDFVVIIVDVDWGLRIGTHTRMCVVRAGAASAF